MAKRDLYEIFSECERIVNRECKKTLKERILEERAARKEERETDHYYMDIVDGALERSISM